ncbi:MAG: DNA double-strand break repair nuclease NurA [Cyanobacteria bacterium J069]
MTLKPSQILQLLDARRAQFTAFDQSAGQRVQSYRAALRQFSQLSEAGRSHLLAKHSHDDLGARPLESLADAPQCVVPWPLQWENREQSLDWARDRLLNVTTFAVDGSQIYPGKDLSIPVALVQIGWFENRHAPGGAYEKDVSVDLMTPQDLREGGKGDPVDRRVNMRRFQLETQRLTDYIKSRDKSAQGESALGKLAQGKLAQGKAALGESASGRLALGKSAQGESVQGVPEKTLVFLDGSMVASFAEPFDEANQQFYVDCLLPLLMASEAQRVPLVAYIDTSYADDLVRMLRILYNLEPADAIHDAQILNSLMRWGDRTPLFLCERPGILNRYEHHRRRVAFTYLKTTRDNYPVRLELPLWLVEAGLADQVIDWVRAEVIAGGGYPYAIETADQTAVLQVGDRQMFFRLLQEWADQQALDLRFSRKMVSKVRRR